MTRRRGHELAAGLRDQGGDGLGILAPERLAGQNYNTGVDVARGHAGLGIGTVHDGPERRRVDFSILGIGRKRYRRLIGGMAVDDHIARGMGTALALEMNAGKDDLGPGGSNIYADRLQQHIVPLPNGIVFQWPGVDIVVVVVRIIAVLVRVKITEHMVVDRMRNAFLVPIGRIDLRTGHLSVPLCGPAVH